MVQGHVIYFAQGLWRKYVRGECKTSFHDYFTKPQSFYAKSVELEVILTDVGCFEMQNAASANQSSRDRGLVRVLPPRFL